MFQGQAVIRSYVVRKLIWSCRPGYHGLKMKQGSIAGHAESHLHGMKLYLPSPPLARHRSLSGWMAGRRCQREAPSVAQACVWEGRSLHPRAPWAGGGRSSLGMEPGRQRGCLRPFHGVARLQLDWVLPAVASTKFLFYRGKVLSCLHITI